MGFKPCSNLHSINLDTVDHLGVHRKLVVSIIITVRGWFPALQTCFWKNDIKDTPVLFLRAKEK